MEFLTLSMVYTMLQTHQELLRRSRANDIAVQLVDASESHFFARAMTVLGELLIRLGTWLKQHSYRRLASEEASAPTFMIML